MASEIDLATKGGLGFLALILALTGITVVAGCDNDGIGPQGTVLERVKPNKLVIDDISQGKITITVGPFAFKHCSQGEKYPLCKTRI